MIPRDTLDQGSTHSNETRFKSSDSFRSRMFLSPVLFLKGVKLRESRLVKSDLQTTILLLMGVERGNSTGIERFALLANFYYLFVSLANFYRRLFLES